MSVSASNGRAPAASSCPRRDRRDARARPEPGPQRGAAEHPRGLAQLLARVRRHHRQPQARRALGHGRRADRLGEHAALERQLAHPHRERRRRRRRSARSGSSSPRRRSPRGAARRAAPRRSPAGASTRSGCVARRSSAASAPGRHGRRRRGREDERPRRVHQQLRHGVVARGERAVGAERLAERADDDVDLVLEAGVVHGAAAARAHAAGRRAPRRRPPARGGGGRARRSRPAARRRRPSRTPSR